EKPAISYRDDCVRASREVNGRPRAQIEAAVNQKQLEFQPPPKKERDRRDDRPRGGLSAQAGDFPRRDGPRGGGFPPRDATPGRSPRDVLGSRESVPVRPAIT